MKTSPYCYEMPSAARARLVAASPGDEKKPYKSSISGAGLVGRAVTAGRRDEGCGARRVLLRDTPPLTAHTPARSFARGPEPASRVADTPSDPRLWLRS